MEKRLLKLITLLVVTFSSVSAQVFPSVYSIKGTLVDSISKNKLEYVTVFLSGTSRLERSTLTKNDGRFLFKDLPHGKYTVTLTGVGYHSKMISVNVEDTLSHDIDLGEITLNTRYEKLREVILITERPIIRQEVDRISYDVQADPESKVVNVLDMLRKVPLVTITADDEIKVKGENNFRILINGRTSSLVSNNPQDVFKSMPANSIKKIEVITTPPAKYDGEGLAGIINIITNQKMDEGYNGSIGASYNSLQDKRLNGTATISKKKLGFIGLVGSSWQNAPTTTIYNFRDTYNPIQSRIEQAGKNNTKGNLTYGNIDLSYEMDSLNLITASFGINSNNNNQNGNQVFKMFNRNQELDYSYRLNNVSNSKSDGIDFGLNYQKGFKKNKERLFTASYKYTTVNSGQRNQNVTTERFNHSNFDIGQKNETQLKEKTVQLDYIHPLRNINIERGLKFISRYLNSDFLNEVYDPVKEEFEPGMFNTFDYRQNIFSIYNSYQLTLNNYVVKAGLRLERTAIDANFATLFTQLKNNYINLIPSIAVQRKFENRSNVNLGYTQRIQRPGIGQLNPFINRSNPFFYTSGNPNLLPVISHSILLNYSRFKKASLNLGLGYSFANNTIQNVITLGNDSISKSSFQNIGESKNLAINLSLNYPISQKLNINLNGRLSYIYIKGVFNGKMYENQGYQGNIFTSIFYKFKNDWTGSINMGSYSRFLLLQGHLNSYTYTSASVSKQLLKKRLTLAASLSNPFQKYIIKKSSFYTLDFIQEANAKSNFRRFDFSLIYRFGKLKDQIKKNKRNIQNDDQVSN